MSTSSAVQSSGSQRERLLQEVRQRIHSLEVALQRVSSTQRSLENNAHEVKSSIHTSVSRQLELLRSREVYLLSQVEAVAGAQEQALRAQRDALCHALGGLTTTLNAQSQECDEATLHAWLSESLDRLNQLDLATEDSPTLSFQADTRGLREAIREFGRVELEDGGQLEGGEGASLPRAFEDYKDAEQHMLYKTLADVKRQQGRGDSISVSIPRLSQRPSDWLMMGAETMRPVSGTESQSAGATFSTHGIEFGGPPPTSIQQWLADIKQQTATEDEDDIEVLPATRTRPDEDMWVGQSEEFPGYPYFSEVLQSPATNWLCTTNATPDTCPYQRMHYFLEASTSNIRHWLLNQGYQLQGDGSPVGCCQGGSSCSAPKQVLPPVDIESLDRLVCVGQDKDVDTEEKQAVPRVIVSEVCRANEPCSSFSECVCDENCGQNVQGDTVTFPYFTSLPKHGWLYGASAEPQGDSLQMQFPVFSSVHDGNSSQWLLGHRTPEVTTPSDPKQEFPYFTEVSQNVQDWLSHLYPGADKNKISSYTMPQSKSSCDDEDVDDDNVNKWLATTCDSSDAPSSSAMESSSVSSTESSSVSSSSWAVIRQPSLDMSAWLMCPTACDGSAKSEWLQEKKDIEFDEKYASICRGVDRMFQDIHQGKGVENWLLKSEGAEKEECDEYESELLKDKDVSTEKETQMWLMNANSEEKVLEKENMFASFRMQEFCLDKWLLKV